MEQMKVPNEMKVEIDFERPGVPYTANILQPVLFKEGNSYCCVLGPDRQRGIFGCGETPEQALQDWDKHLTERVEQDAPGDELISFVNENLSKQVGKDNVATNNPVIVPKEDQQFVKTVASGPNEVKVISEHRVRKNTTDQSNVDGSEFQ